MMYYKSLIYVSLTYDATGICVCCVSSVIISFLSISLLLYQVTRSWWENIPNMTNTQLLRLTFLVLSNTIMLKQHHLDTNSLTSLQILPNMGIALGRVLNDSTNRDNKWTNYVE